MEIQLETIHGILFAIMVCQGVRVIGQWLFHSELMELKRELRSELRRIATLLERVGK